MQDSIISVRGLAKTFKLKQKQAGLAGSWRSIWKPEMVQVTAVSDITFSLPKGQVLAFIGPNGAGKSTTIKMLTGILHPSAGMAQVMGFVPWRDRRQMGYQIGTVFGQKPQLWYHLPAEDTFRLFSKIYELDEHDFKRRRGFLVEAFQLAHLLNTPVRKLSLGQRMKCEIAASLLHSPPIVFLDEPTIGLDVVAKQQIRQAIRTLNEEENTTIFLTSHDAGDIESLCERVIIINHGRLIYDDSTQALKRNFLRRKVIDVQFSKPLTDPFDLPHIETIAQESQRVKLAFDTQQIPIEAVIQQIMARQTFHDITIEDPPLEAIIREIYQAPAHAETSREEVQT